jgi:S-adenosylhomocysteine hydrolase
VGTTTPIKRKEVIKMKKFKVVANSTIMDAEINVRTMDEAQRGFEAIRDSGSYHKVYIMDNETGEVYRTYDISQQAGGVMIQEWYTIGG